MIEGAPTKESNEAIYVDFIGGKEPKSTTPIFDHLRRLPIVYELFKNKNYVWGTGNSFRILLRKKK